MDDIKTMYQKVKEIFTTEHHIDLDTDNMLTEQLFTDYISSQLEPPVSGQQLAEQFHKLYEGLAPQFGYETKEETKTFNPESNNGKLMIAVSEQILKWLFR